MELTLDKKFDERELALVCAARTGDREAIEQLLLHNWDWLKALVIGIVRRTAEVDDVLQEICIRVINKIDQLREPHSYRAWLACLARREAIKWCRQRTRQGQDVPPADRPIRPSNRTAPKRRNSPMNMNRCSAPPRHYPTNIERCSSYSTAGTSLTKISPRSWTYRSRPFRFAWYERGV